MEPIRKARFGAVLFHVEERLEAAAALIEHRIQKHPDASSMAFGNQFLQFIVGAKMRINPHVIPGIVFMAAVCLE
ncbi:hypothetical protein D3C81_1942490 [compost metagenome]